MSGETKKYKTKYWVCRVLSILLNFGPLIGFSIYAFVVGQPKQKLALGCIIVVALILTALNIMFKYHLRCITWILLLGVYIVIDNILPLIITFGVCTIIDDLLIEPLCKKYKEKVSINKEIDKRIA